MTRRGILQIEKEQQYVKVGHAIRLAVSVKDLFHINFSSVIFLKEGLCMKNARKANLQRYKNGDFK